MILDTKKHQVTAEEIDSQILIDSDLSILGAAAAEYWTYAQGIRQEYAWVKDKEYRQKRKTLLEKFLECPRIYYTEEKFNQLEKQARLNLQSEIISLI